MWGGEGVSFHAFTLSEHRSARLLVKNLGSGMTESVVREELEALDIHFQGVMQLLSGRSDQDPAKDRPLTPHFIVSKAGGSEVSKVDLSPNSAVCECWWNRKWLPSASSNTNAATASATRSVTADTRPGASLVVAPTYPVGAQHRGNSLSAVAAVATIQRVTGAV
jgi:hypothetical protein